ncbi:hypothetical protein EJA70_11275 [Pseudomonas sp. PB103]|nr:hypothetical protein EJA70_11275 [Pseudomonas sp. PB103]
MKRNTGNREKMWAGQTAPFFCPQKSQRRRVGDSVEGIAQKQKRPLRAFFSDAGQISVRGL